jgi:hypothetical protein
LWYTENGRKLHELQYNCHGSRREKYEKREKFICFQKCSFISADGGYDCMHYAVDGQGGVGNCECPG